MAQGCRLLHESSGVASSSTRVSPGRDAFRENRMEFRETIETTGTCRFFRKDPVPHDVLKRVLDAARWAPTGGNRQGVRFVIVRDAAKRRALRDLYVPLWEQYASRATAKPGAPMPRLLANADHMARHLDEVPVLVVVCAQT